MLHMVYGIFCRNKAHDKADRCVNLDAFFIKSCLSDLLHAICYMRICFLNLRPIGFTSCKFENGKL